MPIPTVSSGLSRPSALTTHLVALLCRRSHCHAYAAPSWMPSVASTRCHARSGDRFASSTLRRLSWHTSSGAGRPIESSPCEPAGPNSGPAAPSQRRCGSFPRRDGPRDTRGHARMAGGRARRRKSRGRHRQARNARGSGGVPGRVVATRSPLCTLPSSMAGQTDPTYRLADCPLSDLSSSCLCSGA